MNYAVPFNRVDFAGREEEYVRQAILDGCIAGDGPFGKLCERLLEETLGIPRVLLTTSCTHALEMAALLLDLQPGDEVIVPAFTFVSTANAFALRGTRPVFVDIRPDTLNLDEARLTNAVTSRTKAIIPVHYGGVGCEMDSILSLAERSGVSVIEDNAHGLFGRWKGKFLGTFGALATQSFHETKNFSCGEGGALLINDSALITRAEILREKGTNRARFFRGEVDKYSWVDTGSSYVLSDILGAFLYGQLEAREKIQSHRAEVWNRYHRSLEEWAKGRGIRLPWIPNHCEQTHHVFYMIMPSLKERQHLIEHLKKQGILSVFHYLPLHLSAMGKRFGGQKGDCPVAEDVSDRLIRLPLYNFMKEEEQLRVIEMIKAF